MSSILSLWKNDPRAFEEKSIGQILGFCGDGKLLDGNNTSKEFRELLNNLPSSLLKKYADECLTSPNSGLMLQDIINQIGTRLGFHVINGLYQGRKNAIGYDGIWTTQDGHKIIIEVKTTDAYRINLNTIAGYRDKLVEQQHIDKDKSSILIVVGRQDTGDLEAQIRGSRHAWDIRLISTDALLKLMSLKDNLNDTRTINQINETLKPMEYTRVDRLIDIIFDTSEDLQLDDGLDTETNEDDDSSGENSHQQEQLRTEPAKFHEACSTKISKFLSTMLIRQAKCLFVSSDGKFSVVCLVSKEYMRNNRIWYWFGFHGSQNEFLKASQNSYVAFGCGTENDIALIPYEEFAPWIENMRTTHKGNRYWWHVSIYEKDNHLVLSQSSGEDIDVSNYLIKNQ